MKPLLPPTLLPHLLAAAAWGAISRAPRIYVNGLPAFASPPSSKTTSPTSPFAPSPRPWAAL